MSINHYIKEIGRGKHNARDLSREQACDLMGQLLDGSVTDLETGAFCIAMRVKGETADELAGFMDALTSRMNRLNNQNKSPIVVLPSYNGARRLPLLTPLLALLLAKQGLKVLVHGGNTEDSRLSTAEVMSALGISASSEAQTLSNEQVVYVPIKQMSLGLWRLLQVRRTIGLLYPPRIRTHHAPDLASHEITCHVASRNRRRAGRRPQTNAQRYSLAKWSGAGYS